MKTLPIILHNKRILLLGASNVALQKALVLHRNKIEFEVIAKEIDEKIKEFTQRLTCKEFEPSDAADYAGMLSEIDMDFRCWLRG